MTNIPNVGPEPSGEGHARKLGGLLSWLGCAWDVVEDIGYVLKLTRFSALVLLIGGLVLILTDQGRDLLVVLGETPISGPVSTSPFGSGPVAAGTGQG